MTQADLLPPFEFHEPDRVLAPILINSPHSGDVYPEHFTTQSRLAVQDLRRSADLHVDQLLAQAPLFGAPLLCVHFPRSFLDVNREPYELDPAMFDGPLPEAANITSVRVTNGYGTVPRLVAESMPIYDRPIPIVDALHRIRHYYLPYHTALSRRLAQLTHQFGRALLVDCHSMPSTSSGSRTPDVVLGDRHGTSCDPAVVDFAESWLRSRGLRVVRNQPYAGGFITECYGQPDAGVDALQIEINRALYMNEATFIPNAGFARISRTMIGLVEALVTTYHNAGLRTRIAAE